ncbi:MAG: SUF system Fe-S cluster assembly regulator [Methylobacter sp.]|nr:MAG: SUF system Fe-S cluster assembly regulator [Methylobacter sp.]PPD23556.1 MAG: SUF system Fe-S cluster assembly regulator [Methylobacter sp.]PPD37360.1 MAG: SUF system Fe-S cluster assembly regulator [Methylomonas sp.]
MLKLSKLTDYTTVILSFMASNTAHIHSALEVAEATGIALPTVSKLLKLLVKAKFLRSVRGAKGGYNLAKRPEEITMADIINLMEGPIALTECSITQQGCGQASGCHIGGKWSLINRTVHNALESVSLADMIMPSAFPSEVLIPVKSLLR